MPLRHVEVQLLVLALVSLRTLVSTENPLEVAALDVSLMDRSTAETSNLVRIASSRNYNDVVDKHNKVRAAVLASNMEYVEQNESLTGDVNAWLSQCSFYDPIEVHWASTRFPYVHGFKAKSLFPFTTSEAINTISQLPNSFSLYKMLMKSDMRYLGCEDLRCTTFGTPYTLIACLYAFKSKLNLTAEPFKIGEPCTECSSGTFWCCRNLCREDCYYSNAFCECKIDCGNYSSDASNCSCLCPNGYEGNQCQQGADDDDDNDDSPSCTESSTALIVSVTLIMLALLSLTLCFLLYHKKYRLSRLRPDVSRDSRSTTTTTIYSTPSSSSPSFDRSKYPSPPPPYSSLSPTTSPDPPPYGWTASPTDVGDEVVEGEIPPPYQNSAA